MFSSRTPVFVATFGMALAWSGCFLSSGPYEASGSGASGGGGSSTTTTTDGTGAASNGGSGGTGASGGSGGGTTSVPPTCTQASQCDDGNPCTDDDCEAGECTHLENNTVVLPDANLTDCKRPVCMQGMVTDQVDKNQTPDVDGDDCTNTYCLDDGTLMTDPDNENQPCLPILDDPCKQNRCVGGICMGVAINEGQVVDPGDTNLPTGGSDCRDLVCAGGMTMLKPNFLNCSDSVPGNCNVRLCSAAGSCGALQVAPAGTPCDTDGNGSLNGKCDGLGGDFSNCKP